MMGALWWEAEAAGDQSRDAGKELAIRCRRCGARHELHVREPVPVLCPECTPVVLEGVVINCPPGQ